MACKLILPMNAPVNMTLTLEVHVHIHGHFDVKYEQTFIKKIHHITCNL